MDFVFGICIGVLFMMLLVVAFQSKQAASELEEDVKAVGAKITDVNDRAEREYLRIDDLLFSVRALEKSVESYKQRLAALESIPGDEHLTVRTKQIVQQKVAEELAKHPREADNFLDDIRGADLERYNERYHANVE